MPKEKIYLFVVIFFYIIQRISELFLNESNETFLKENFKAIEINPLDSLRMKLFHVTWFISLTIEVFHFGKFPQIEYTIILFLLLSLCLLIRYHTINILKEFWTIKIYKIEPQPIIKEGLYQYIRHPNYLAVIIELFAIPMLLNAQFTLIFFGIGNFIILKYRITLEEQNLIHSKNFNKDYLSLKRFIPYIY